MTNAAPRSIEDYLSQLRGALDGEDPALIQDALYDAEEYLRSEVAAHPDKAEADVLELIASTYGAPEEVAAAYRDTEAKVKAALKTPSPATPANAAPNRWRRFFGVFLDPRAYSSLFYMLLSLATGIVYFVFVVTGLSLSAGLAILIVGIPVFLAFIGIGRVISLGEGRLLEAVTGERMPRRPVHPGPPQGWWSRIGEMLKDPRTWTTLLYFVLMLPLGIVYFVIAVIGLAVGTKLAFAPFAVLLWHVGFLSERAYDFSVRFDHGSLPHAAGFVGSLFMAAFGLLALTVLLHVARAVATAHARFAKALLVEPGA